jgi:hypothetical protein
MRGGHAARAVARTAAAGDASAVVKVPGSPFRPEGKGAREQSPRCGPSPTRTTELRRAVPISAPGRGVRTIPYSTPFALGWYSPSGWERKEYSRSFPNNGTVTSTNTYGKYRNGTFCLTVDTWTEHKKTFFEGRRDGWWQWAYDVDKWGGCTGLLHYEYIVDTP